MKDIFDDKTIIIIAMTIISLACIVNFGKDSLDIVENVVSGMLGMAIGRIGLNK